VNASRQTLVASAAICALLAALFVARWRLAPLPVETPFEGGMPLAAILTRFSFPGGGWFAAALGALSVGWTMLVVVQLGIKYAPPGSRNFLPPQIFLAAAGGLALAGDALASLTAALLLALSLRRLASSFHKGYSFPELFHGGFYLGLIPLLYAPAALAVPVIAASAVFLYRRSLREAVVCLAGVLFPVPAAGFVHWALGGEGGYIYAELWRCTLEAPSRPGFEGVPTLALVAAALLTVPALVATIWVTGHKKGLRKAQHKFVGVGAIALATFAATSALPGASTFVFALCSVPCAVVWPWAFTGRVARFSTALYCVTLGAVLALDLLPILGIPVP
jgi:hypothetical protein